MKRYTTYYAVVNSSASPYTVKEWTTDAASKSTLTSDDDGKVYISGLGAGAYYLYESAAPTGYTAWTDPMTIVIKAETNATTTTSLSATIGETTVDDTAIDKTAGKITASITNSSSSSLPSTGGIGTTIFYIVGAILVLGAGVILITRRRMASR